MTTEEVYKNGARLKKSQQFASRLSGRWCVIAKERLRRGVFGDEFHVEDAGKGSMNEVREKRCGEPARL